MGETLSAQTSSISDADGLENASFGYQWILVNGNSEEPASGATGASYTLTSNDVGNKVKVRVSFTDDAGNQKELISSATAIVERKVTQPGPPLNLTVSPAGAGELAVSWEPPDDEGGSDILLYILRWRETGDSKDTGSASVSGTAHTITGLSAGTEYTV